jgi:amino-acid N-acetyltransferase
MVTIRPCVASQLPLVRELISSAGLPLDGFGSVPSDVFVAVDDDVIVGSATLEHHSGHGLLRSVAVAADRRGEGIGSALVEATEHHATGLGFDGLFLLTETAADFFADRGYEVIERDGAPGPIVASTEWAVACGATAVPMSLTFEIA